VRTTQKTSEPNGQKKPSRLDRFEASHIKLMMAHEVFLRVIPAVLR
jgi:hypothetical protein